MKYRLILFLSIIICIVISCRKDTNLWFSETGTSEQLDDGTIKLYGNIIKKGKTTKIEYGIEYYFDGNDYDTKKIKAGSDELLGTYNIVIDPYNLSYKKVYFRSYISELGRKQYGDYNHLDIKYSPIITTDTISNITGTSVKCKFTFKKLGSIGYSSVWGVCWSTSSLPIKLSSNYTNMYDSLDNTGYKYYSADTGKFSCTISGLSPNTTYHVRAYICDDLHTYYGTDISFTTTTMGASAIGECSVTSTSATTATSTCTISDPGETILAKGVCWNTSGLPTIYDYHRSEGTSAGTFSSYITGLNSTNIYYVRAYITTSSGTYYGPVSTVSTIVWTADFTDYSVITSSYKSQVFYDGFSDNSNSWSTYNTNTTLSISSGSLYLSHNELQYINNIPTTINTFSPNGNFEIEASVKQTYYNTLSNGASTGIGIIWGSLNNYRYYSLNFNKGEYYIGTSNNSTWTSWTTNYPTAYPSLIGTSTSSFFKVTIRRINGKYYFFINGVFVNSYSGDTLLSTDKSVGFAIDNATAYIDWISVSSLNL